MGQQIICAQAGEIEVYAVDSEENNGQGTTGSSYSWLIVEPSFNGTIVPLTTSGNQIEIDWSSESPGIYTLVVNETNSFDCVSENQLLIELQEPPTVSIDAPSEVCEDEMISLAAILAGSASSVTWSSNGDGQFDTPTQTTTTYFPGDTDRADGTVQIIATTNDPAGSAGCDAQESVANVTILPLQVPIFSINSDYCFGDSPDQLPVISNNGISGNWNPAVIDTETNGEATYLFEPNDECISNYTLEVRVNPCGCVFETEEITELCQGEEFVFPDGRVANTSQLGEFSTEILLPVQNDCDLLTRYITRVSGPEFPTAFSPFNRDGKNDEFKIIDNVCGVEDYYLKIYNRWGELVFETNRIDQAWMGEQNNKKSQAGVYVWQAEYTLNNNTYKRQGTIQLIQ